MWVQIWAALTTGITAIGESDHKIIDWFSLEGILATIQLQPWSYGQRKIPLDQVDQIEISERARDHHLNIFSFKLTLLKQLENEILIVDILFWKFQSEWL